MLDVSLLFQNIYKNLYYLYIWLCNSTISSFIVQNVKNVFALFVYIRSTRLEMKIFAHGNRNSFSEDLIFNFCHFVSYIGGRL